MPHFTNTVNSDQHRLLLAKSPQTILKIPPILWVVESGETFEPFWNSLSDTFLFFGLSYYFGKRSAWRYVFLCVQSHRVLPAMIYLHAEQRSGKWSLETHHNVSCVLMEMSYFYSKHSYSLLKIWQLSESVQERRNGSSEEAGRLGKHALNLTNGNFVYWRWLGRHTFSALLHLKRSKRYTFMFPVVLLQRIRATVNTQEQKRLLMDLDISMRTVDCFYTVTFYGALFREVTHL